MTGCTHPKITMKRCKRTLVLTVSMLASVFAVDAYAAAPDLSKLPLPVPRKVDFEKDVYPIFTEKCISCHGPKKQKGKYRMDTKEGTFKAGDSGPFIIAGNSEKSPIIHMVAGLIEEGLMPPPSDKKGESEPLTKEQIGILRAWIDQGAAWPDGPIKEFIKKVTFKDDVGPMLAAACGACHGAAKADGNFRVDTREALLTGGKGYGKVIQPGNADKSTLLVIAAGKDEDLPQPEKHRLPAKQVELIRTWITQGAE